MFFFFFFFFCYVIPNYQVVQKYVLRAKSISMILRFTAKQQTKKTFLYDSSMILRMNRNFRHQIQEKPSLSDKQFSLNLVLPRRLAFLL